MAKLRVILFDMDDTLLKLNVDWKSLTEDIDADYFNGNYSYLNPHGFFVAYFSKLLDRLTGKQRTAVRKRRLDAERQGAVTETCFPYRGTIAMLSELYKLGVVSGNYGPTVRAALSRCGLRRYMRALVSIDDCPVSKPSPEPLFMALRMLKERPERALYVGDDPDDIRAGKAAGMRTVGVAASDGAFHALEEVAPDAIISNVGELPKALLRIELSKRF